MATDRMPSLFKVEIIRTAISPLFATRTPSRSGVNSFEVILERKDVISEGLGMSGVVFAFFGRG